LAYVDDSVGFGRNLILPTMGQALPSIWPLFAKKFDGFVSFASGSWQLLNNPVHSNE